jgi:hypothetical protein
MRIVRIAVAGASVAGLLMSGASPAAHAWPAYADSVTCASTTAGYYPDVSNSPAGGVSTGGPLTCAAAESGVPGISPVPYLPPGPYNFTLNVGWAPVGPRTGTFAGTLNITAGTEGYVLSITGAFVGGVGTFVTLNASDGDPYSVVGIGPGHGTLVEACEGNVGCVPHLNQLSVTFAIA